MILACFVRLLTLHRTDETALSCFSVSPSQPHKQAAMTKFQAFCRGFWSVCDPTIPFTQRQSMFLPNEKFDIRRERERLGLDIGYWQTVGNHLYKAMSDYENKVNSDVYEQQ
jgi:hypothetical protein